MFLINIIVPLLCILHKSHLCLPLRVWNWRWRRSTFGHWNFRLYPSNSRPNRFSETRPMQSRCSPPCLASVCNRTSFEWKLCPEQLYQGGLLSGLYGGRVPDLERLHNQVSDIEIIARWNRICEARREHRRHRNCRRNEMRISNVRNWRATIRGLDWFFGTWKSTSHRLMEVIPICVALWNNRQRYWNGGRSDTHEMQFRICS